MKSIKQEWLLVVSQANKKLNNSAYLDLSNITPISTGNGKTFCVKQ